MTPTLSDTLSRLAPLLPERLVRDIPGWRIFLDGGEEASSGFIVADEGGRSYAPHAQELAILQATLQQACEARGWAMHLRMWFEDGHTVHYAAVTPPDDRKYSLSLISGATASYSFTHVLAPVLLAALEAQL